jgi:hypothetical protein
VSCGKLELLGQLSEIGATLKPAGDNLIVRAGAMPIPAELVARIREAKPALLTVLHQAAEWHSRQQEALAHWGVLHSASEAAQLAWGELEVRWHCIHGERFPEWQCAGCGEPIGGLPALGLADGTRVHCETLNCLLRYGDRWRRGATEGLSMMGLNPPH